MKAGGFVAVRVAVALGGGVDVAPAVTVMGGELVGSRVRVGVLS